MSSSPSIPPISSPTPATGATGGLPVSTASSAAAPGAASGDNARPSLTDFLDLGTLQEIQDSFTAVTQLATQFRDADGRPLTAPTDLQQQARSQRILNHLIAPDATGGDGSLEAPIVVEDHELGSIVIGPPTSASPQASTLARERLRQMAYDLGIPGAKVDAFIQAADCACGPNRAAAAEFLYSLANNIARLCYQEYQLRQRYEELATLHQISTFLAGQRDLEHVLQVAAKSTAEALKVKAASVRLLNDAGDQLLPRAPYNLSKRYLDKGPVPLEKSQIDREALTTGKVVYVRDMTDDPRVLYPEDAQREGLVSLLCAGMIHRGKPVGAIRLYTEEPRQFSKFEVKLLQSIAQLLAAAIENARLDAARIESLRVQRQLRMGGDVQRRMFPAAMPRIPPFDIAARCVPSFELAGDFYDFIKLDSHMGVAVGDVVGKGIAASLLMASVRASLRAYAQDIYDMDEIIARVNTALTRDTLDNEFVTLFYGVLDPVRRRMTYCNAGHEPALLLRQGEFVRLEAGGMLLGIDATQKYEKGLIDLRSGDLLLLYTDGLTEALNFSGEAFGRQRTRKALLEGAQFRTAHETLNHILWEMRRFVGLNHSTDDTTLVVIRVG